MIKDSIKELVALFFAFLLKGVIYSLGDFDFDRSPLFSSNFFCDLIILIICYLPCLFIVGKIINRRNKKLK